MLSYSSTPGRQSMGTGGRADPRPKPPTSQEPHPHSVRGRDALLFWMKPPQPSSQGLLPGKGQLCESLARGQHSVMRALAQGGAGCQPCARHCSELCTQQARSTPALRRGPQGSCSRLTGAVGAFQQFLQHIVLWLLMAGPGWGWMDVQQGPGGTGKCANGSVITSRPQSGCANLSPMWGQKTALNKGHDVSPKGWRGQQVREGQGEAEVGADGTWRWRRGGTSGCPTPAGQGPGRGRWLMVLMP